MHEDQFSTFVLQFYQQNMEENLRKMTNFKHVFVHLLYENKNSFQKKIRLYENKNSFQKKIRHKSFIENHKTPNLILRFDVDEYFD